MPRRNRVDEIHPRFESRSPRLFHAPLPVGRIVPRIRDAHLLNADIRHATVIELMDGMRVNGETAASSVNDSKRGFLDASVNQPVALPRIFTQFPDALRQLHRTAELDRLKAGVIQVIGDRNNHACAHAISPKALLAIAQCCINKTNFFHAKDTKRSSMPNQEVRRSSGFLSMADDVDVST